MLLQILLSGFEANRHSYTTFQGQSSSFCSLLYTMRKTVTRKF